jgi:hypothetical protein
LPVSDFQISPKYFAKDLSLRAHFLPANGTHFRRKNGINSVSIFNYADFGPLKDGVGFSGRC